MCLFCASFLTYRICFIDISLLSSHMDFSSFNHECINESEIMHYSRVFQTQKTKVTMKTTVHEHVSNSIYGGGCKVVTKYTIGKLSKRALF